MSTATPADNKDNKPTLAFNFGAGTTGSTQPSVFGSAAAQPATSTNASTPSGFGSANNSSPFAFGLGAAGNSTPNATPNVFGAKPTGTIQMAFGGNNTASSSPFGNAGGFTFGGQQPNNNAQK